MIRIIKLIPHIFRHIFGQNIMRPSVIINTIHFQSNLLFHFDDEFWPMIPMIFDNRSYDDNDDDDDLVDCYKCDSVWSPTWAYLFHALYIQSKVTQHTNAAVFM